MKPMYTVMRHLLMLSLLLSATAAQAWQTTHSNYKDKTSIVEGTTTIGATDFSYTQDTIADHVNRSSSVRLSYMRSSFTDVASSTVSSTIYYWYYEIQYRIYKATTPGTYQTGTLRVSYGTDASGSPTVYEDISTHSIDYYNMELQVDSVKAAYSTDGITYTAITTPSTSTFIPDDIRLELLINTVKYRSIATSTVPKLHFNSTTGELSWTYVPGAEEYDVEWTFIDSMETNTSFTNDEDPFLYKSPTRITTSDQHFRLDLTYPKGTLYFRARAVGRHTSNVNGDYTHSQPCDWGYRSDSDPLSDPVTYSIGTSFEEDKNWQYVISFAEEGKNKKVLTYYDGGLRDRQSLTHLSTDQTTVIAEKKYDSEGRPVVSILPVPIFGTGLNHQKHFNVDVNGADFVAANFEDGASDPLGNTSGAGKYYSSANTFTSDALRDYIPDGGGYPYTQVEYTRDNTGRIRKASGIGPDHVLNAAGSHETQYYYTTAASTELHRLFGSNVGDASHYKKQLMRDANGQYSVSYMDQEGRTIATALAGESPSNLIALDSNISRNITVNLSGNNVIDPLSLTSTNISVIMNLFDSTRYDFIYDMEGAIYTSTFVSAGLIPVQVNECVSCRYALTVSITGPDGASVTLHPNDTTVINDTIADSTVTCPSTSYPGDSLTFYAYFTEPGEYTVTKKLELLSFSDAELDSLLENAGMGQSYLDSLISLYQSNVDTTVCDITCEDHCRTWVRENYPLLDVNSQAFQDSVDVCQRSLCGDLVSEGMDTVAQYQCESILEQMRQDVSATGPDGPGFHWSESTGIAGAFWARVDTLIANNTINIYDSTGTELTSAVDIKSATWDPDWADQLVLAHREYCHYTACVLRQESDKYDMEMALITSWSEAKTEGFLDPLGMGNSNISGGTYSITNSYRDPAFVGAAADSASMRSYLSSYSPYYPVTGVNNLWDFASDNTNDVYSSTNPYDDTTRWRTFRALYLAIKQELLAANQESAPCPYYTDDEAIVQRPPHDFTDTTDMQNLADELSGIMSDNSDLCAANVSIWMDSLSVSCGIDTLFTQAELDSVREALYNYCMTSAGPANPLGIITDEAVAAGQLDDVAAILGGLGSGCDSSIASISMPSPYLHCTEQSVTVHAVDTCFVNLLEFMNDSVFPIYDTGTVCYAFANYSTYDFCGYPQSAVGIQVSPTSIDFYAGPDCGGTICKPFLRFFEIDSNEVAPTEIIKITSPYYTVSSPISPSGAGSFKNVRATAYTTSGVTTVYLYGGGCNDLIDTISEVMCVVDSMTAYEVTVSLDSLRQNCIEDLLAQAEAQARQDYALIVDDFKSQLLNQRMDSCFGGNLDEDFFVNYDTREYHYTLYYYDQSGNLVQTVPPKGVKPLAVALPYFSSNGTYLTGEPAHELKTVYAYNSLNQIRTQTTPDAGVSNMWYDNKGRLVASRNAKQNQTNYTYSYTLYDEQGRIDEVGEVVQDTALTQIVADTEADFEAWLNGGTKTQVTRTQYDEALAGNHSSKFTNGQQNLRSRVAGVTFSEEDEATTTWATHYSYDEHGNVKELVQDNAAMDDFSDDVRYKKIEYEYDLISSKVTKVSYQGNMPDQFYHKYYYDADNRLTVAMTSRTDLNIGGDLGWEKDAKYFYYKHGPLERAEIGEDKVQAMDHVYTLQGWIKGVNSNTLYTNRDPGKDGNLLSGAMDPNNANSVVAQDAFGYTLGYYDGDYSSIGTIAAGDNFEATAWGTALDNTYHLFNGNINHMVTAFTDNNEDRVNTQGMRYRYDQLNRLKHANAYRNMSGSTDLVAQNNTFANATDNDDYREWYKYDANGNILNLSRHGISTNANGHKMDSLSYSYYANTNQLEYVDDVVVDTAYTTDIDDQSSGNYAYDAIGNLITDAQEEIDTIEWSVYGKVRKITRTSSSSKPDLEFKYDPVGNRVVKISKPRSGGILLKEENWTYTYYLRDAQGNVMATYDRDITLNSTTVSDSMKLSELHIYGSSRVGMRTEEVMTGGITYTMLSDGTYDADGRFVINPTHTDLTADALPDTNRRMRKKRFELTNHLGNVIAVISDKKLGINTTSPGSAFATATYFTADVMSAGDYYSFGMQMGGRTFSGGDYRYGFNGKEKDNEVSGNGNSYDYGFRIYNPRLGKFLSVDPLFQTYPYYTPYQFASNMPIKAIDVDGLESSENLNSNEKQGAAASKASGKTSEALKALEQKSESQAGAVTAPIVGGGGAGSGNPAPTSGGSPKVEPVSGTGGFRPGSWGGPLLTVGFVLMPLSTGDGTLHFGLGNGVPISESFTKLNPTYYTSPIFGSNEYNPYQDSRRDEAWDKAFDYLSRPQNQTPAIVYELVAREEGWYLNYNSNPKSPAPIGSVYLKTGEVWKYGFSTNAGGRYKPYSYESQFQMNIIYVGTRNDALAVEKFKILKYYWLPENTLRHPEDGGRLARPAGNKIFR